MKYLSTVVLVMVLAMVGCEKKGPMEQAADDMNSAMKDAGKQLDSAAKDAGKAADEATK